MSLTTAPFRSNEVAAIVPEIWTPIVLEELFDKTVALNYFTDLSQYVSAGGDKAHVPDAYTNTYSVRTQSTQGDELTTERQALVDVTLDVDTHSYIAVMIGDKELQQIASGIYDINDINAKKLGGTLRNDIEAKIFALWSSITNSVMGDTGTVMSDLEVRQSIRTMRNLGFPLDELAWFFHPTVLWDQVFGISKYYDVSQAGWQGGNESIIRSGNFGPSDVSRGLRGMLYGVPVYESTNVVSGLQTYRNLLAHPTAFGFAFQTPQSPVRMQSEYQLRNLAALTVLDSIYGVGEIRDDAAVVVNANVDATTS